MTNQWRQANPLARWEWEEWADEYMEYCGRKGMKCDALAMATFLNATVLHRINNELMDFDHQISMGLKNAFEESNLGGCIAEAIERHTDSVAEDES